MTASIPAADSEEKAQKAEDTESQPEEPASSPPPDDDEQAQEPLNVELHPIKDNDTPPPPTSASQSTTQSVGAPLYDDPSDSDDGEGEWITPTNVGLHKSRALDLLPSDGGKKGKGKAKDELISVGCMTADFAMQNVLLQMGLNLVGTEGKRIQRLKTWVLRCHACFKSVLRPVLPFLPFSNRFLSQNM